MLLPQPFFAQRGSPINIYQVCKVLSRLGHEVDLVCYHIGEEVDIDNVNIKRIPKVPFIREVPVGASYKKLFLDPLLFFKALGMLLKKRYDIIHAVEETIFFGVILKKIFRIPVIYDMDSDIPEQLAYTGFMKNRVFLKFARNLEKWAIRESLLVLTVCYSLTRSIEEKCPGMKTFQIEDIPIPGRKVEEKEVEDLKKALDIKDEIIILYTGNFESYQGVGLLIEGIPQVIKQQKDVKFVLVGGKEEQIERMKELAESLNVQDFLSFPGNRPLSEMPVFMEMAHILTSPRVEGTNTPLKIYTYLQSGKPVVATRLFTHTQVLNDDVAMLTDPNPKGFAQGILELLKDEGLRAQLGKSGKKLVEEEYSEKKFAEKVEKVYNFVASRSK